VEPKELPNGRWQCPLCEQDFKNRKTCMVHRWSVHKVIQRVSEVIFRIELINQSRFRPR
jgi:hypothetical protein